MLVLLIAFLLWLVKKNNFPSRAFYKKARISTPCFIVCLFRNGLSHRIFLHVGVNSIRPGRFYKIFRFKLPSCKILISKVIYDVFSPQNVDTVRFSNEAYNGSSVMSFDNVLYDNLDSDPVLMQPLDFPIDDKHPLPEVRY